MVDCWLSYNRSLVGRGEILFSYDFLNTWDSELEDINQNKIGKPFHISRFFPPSHWLHTLLISSTIQTKQKE